MRNGDSTTMTEHTCNMLVGEKRIELRFHRKAKKLSKHITSDVRKSVIKRYLAGEFGENKLIEADMNKQIDAYIERKNITHGNREYIKHFLWG